MKSSIQAKQRDKSHQGASCRAPLRAERLLNALLSIAVAACAGDSRDVRSGVSEPFLELRGLDVEALAALDDGGAAILARPHWISVDSRGRWIISDRSDKDIKIYSASGERVGTFGRSGGGPGEFRSLFSSGIYRDSVVAYDFASGKLSVLAPDGSFGRAVQFAIPPWKVQVVDDSLLLLIGHPVQQRPLLMLAKPDGTVLKRFFSRDEYFRGVAAAMQHSAVFADAYGGVVFAGLFGGDSIFAFNYRGERIAAGPVDPEAPLPSLRRLVEENQGAMRRPDGSWVHHGARMLVQVVALADSAVALQVVEYDAHVGADPVEGGTLLVGHVQGDEIRIRARQHLDWGLFGRDRVGRALVMAYADSLASSYVIGRLIERGPSHLAGR